MVDVKVLLQKNVDAAQVDVPAQQNEVDVLDFFVAFSGIHRFARDLVHQVRNDARENRNLNDYQNHDQNRPQQRHRVAVIPDRRKQRHYEKKRCVKTVVLPRTTIRIETVSFQKQKIISDCLCVFYHVQFNRAYYQ